VNLKAAVLSMFWHRSNTCASLLSPLIVNHTANLKRKPGTACAGATEMISPYWQTALGLGCEVCTEEQDFFATGIAGWTANGMEIFLKSQNNRTEAEPE
jgi:hypothetical protein